MSDAEPLPGGSQSRRVPLGKAGLFFFVKRILSIALRTLKHPQPFALFEKGTNLLCWANLSLIACFNSLQAKSCPVPMCRPLACLTSEPSHASDGNLLYLGMQI